MGESKTTFDSGIMREGGSARWVKISAEIWLKGNALLRDKEQVYGVERHVSAFGLKKARFLS